MICYLVTSEFGCPCSFFFALGIQYQQNLIRKRARNSLGVLHLVSFALLTDLAHYERYELVFLSKLEHMSLTYSLKQMLLMLLCFWFP